jgi:hypothetical protein
MMEKWNTGVWGTKTRRNPSFRYSNIPTFQFVIVPIFQYSDIPMNKGGEK